MPDLVCLINLQNLRTEDCIMSVSLFWSANKFMAQACRIRNKSNINFVGGMCGQK